MYYFDKVSFIPKLYGKFMNLVFHLMISCGPAVNLGLKNSLYFRHQIFIPFIIVHFFTEKRTVSTFV